MTFDLDLGEMIDLSLYLQQYEPEVTAAIARYGRPGMSILDIGANIGAHTIRFANLTGPAGKVVAFEPTDFAFAKLTRNLSLNDVPHVTAVKVALSDTALPPQQVNFRASWRTDDSRRDGVSSVPFERLDAWAERNGLDRVDLIKIDVDGNEFPLMMGALETIRRNLPIMLMEVCGLHFDDDRRNPFALLHRLGYRFFDLRSGKELTIEEMRNRTPRNDVCISMSFNIVCLPPKNEALH
jgi:FkbM family methyltransferase